MRKIINITVLLFALSSVLFAQSVSKTEIPKSDEEEITRMAQQLSNALTKSQKKLVVIASFVDLNGKVTSFGKSITDKLEAELSMFQGSFNIISTKNLDKTLEQEKIKIDEISETEQLKKINKSLGVDSIIIGTISDLGLKNEVIAKIIDVETGFIINSSRIQQSKNSSVVSSLEKLDKDLDAIIKSDKISNTEKKQNKESKEPKATEFKNDFKFEIQSCKLSSQSITCDLLITNELDVDQTLWLDNNSQAYDENGQVYNTKKVQLGNKSNSLKVDSLLISKVPVKASITFGEIKSEISQIKYFRFSFRYSNKIVRSYSTIPFTVDFKNFPITKEN